MNKKDKEMMQMSPWDFDQSPNGWRKFEARKDYLKVADLISRYIAVNKNKILQTPALKKGKTIGIEILYFHIGQQFALEGQDHYEKAIKSFRQSFRGKGECWNLYVSATIGFLEDNIKEVENSIELIEKSKDEYKESGNINIVKNFKEALLNGEYDYREVYSRPRN